MLWNGGKIKMLLRRGGEKKIANKFLVLPCFILKK